MVRWVRSDDETLGLLVTLTMARRQSGGAGNRKMHTCRFKAPIHVIYAHI